jgi:hypothetical protein
VPAEAEVCEAYFVCAEKAHRLKSDELYPVVRWCFLIVSESNCLSAQCYNVVIILSAQCYNVVIICVVGCFA